MKRLASGLAAVAFIVVASCAGPGNRHSSLTVQQVRAEMTPYCARWGQVPKVTIEDDGDGQSSVYGDCVYPRNA